MYQCNHEGSSGIWTSAVDSLRKRIETQNTDPNISTLFVDALLYIARKGNDLPQCSNLTLNCDILRLGWPSIILGFITKSLVRTQQTYFTHIGSKQQDSNGPSRSSHKSGNLFTSIGSTTLHSSTQEKR